MVYPILLPSLSPTMEEGTIVKWFFKEGDFVESGAALCGIETDKATVDYEALDEGYLRVIVQPEGANASVNTLIAVITEEEDEEFDLEQIKKDAELSAPAPAEDGDKGGEESDNDDAKKSASSESSAPATPPPSSAPAQPSFQAPSQPSFKAPAPTGQTSDGRVKASPLAKKIAEEKGIDLRLVTGSGPGGRIIKEDVQNYTPAAQAVAQGGAPARPKPADLPAKIGSLAPPLEQKDVALTKMRKAIGKRLLQSYNGAPAFFVTQKVVMDNLLALREQLKQINGYKISINDLILKASAVAIKAHPEVNAYYTEEAIKYNSSVDISVAVAIPDGLITPIVAQADLKPLGYISSEVRDLVGKAKNGTLQPHEFQGGTFSISNLGMYGVSSFTSIINPPQSCILAIAGLQDELFRDSSGDIKDRKYVNLTLTADHRVVDGALAAEFMNTLKEVIEAPASLLL